MTVNNKSVSYVDTLCDIKKAKKFVAAIDDLFNRWEQIPETERLQLWEDLHIDDYFKMIEALRDRCLSSKKA